MVVRVIITSSNGKQCHWQPTFWNIGSPVKYLAWKLRHCLSRGRIHEKGSSGKEGRTKGQDYSLRYTEERAYLALVRTERLLQRAQSLREMVDLLASWAKG